MEQVVQKRILPLQYPLIATYPHHANILAMLSTNKYNNPAVMNHFFQLAFNKRTYRLDFHISYSIVWYIKNYPLVQSQSIGREMLECGWNGSCTELFIDSINRGYYIYCLVNTQHIKAYQYDQQEVLLHHDIFIYGYNEEAAVFYCADHFNSKYSFAEVPFSELEEAFYSMPEHDWLNGIQLYRLKEDVYGAIIYDIEYIRQCIESYLESTPSSYVSINDEYERNPDEFSYGMQIYDEIAEYLNEMKHYQLICDLRIFHLMYDHKKYVAFLLSELFEIRKIQHIEKYIEGYAKLENVSLTIRNTIIKYNMTREKALLDPLYQLIESMKRDERQLLVSLLQDLTKKAFSIASQLKDIDRTEHRSIWINYHKEWRTSAHAPNQSMRSSSVVGASITYQFYGNGIKLIGERLKNGGQAKVTIDGMMIDYIDYYAEQSRKEVLLYEKDGMKNGYHSITIEHIGCDRIGAKKTSINVSSFEVVSCHCQNDTPSMVQPLEHDTTTGGQWLDKYGTAGYTIVGRDHKLPDYMNSTSLSFLNADYVLLTRSNGDHRALQDVETDKKIAAYLLHSECFDVEMLIPGERLRSISLYVLDYDGMQRRMNIQFIDIDTGDMLHEESVSQFSEGIYMNYLVRGNIRIRFYNDGSCDAVISAIFFND